MPREAAFMAGIFVLAALLWVTEALPLFATALLVIGLQLVLLANPGNWPGLGFASGDSPGYRAVLHGAADPVLVLFFGGFLLAEAAVKERVDRSMSALLLNPFGERPGFVMAGVMLVTALFSMFMSNTATTAMMITLVMPLLAQMPREEPFRKGLVLAVPVAANIGGMGTPIGSPPNAVAVGYLQNAGQPLGFLPWMLVAVPLMLVMLAFGWWLLWRFHRPHTGGLRIRPQGEPITGRGWFVVGTFTVTVLLWLTDRWHGLPASVVALLPAVVFTASGVLSRTELNRIEWNVLILIAGGISLGAGMTMTGLDRVIVGWLPVGGGQSLLLLLGVLVLATILLSTFMSNTAAANLLLPIGVTAATVAGAGANTVQMTLCIALAASLAMSLPISTPPNAIAYARNEFTTRDLVRVGVWIGAAGAVLVLGGVGVMLRLWGMG
jgi:solute carrier family 13 (sodium-dependent dicarboxylate transporter), member 2/3/5